jgi:hypothetical protein
MLFRDGASFGLRLEKVQMQSNCSLIQTYPIITHGFTDIILGTTLYCQYLKKLKLSFPRISEQLTWE